MYKVSEGVEYKVLSVRNTRFILSSGIYSGHIHETNMERHQIVFW